jgi:ABC-2 type transport system permease protein
MTASDPLTLVIAPHRSVPARLQAVWRYRELLVGLIRKELKVKYKDSSLGFLWSMLNPAMYLVVFYVVFQVILGSGIPYFTVFLLSGLLAWNLFSGSLMGATGSVVGNGALVNKVYFPREILPLASVGATLVHFCLQVLVLMAALTVFRYDVDLAYLSLAPVAVLVLLVLAAGLAVLLAALNVYFRDLQHLMELVMLAWFWMTPIVYPWQLQADQLASRGVSTLVTLVNPITAVIVTLQRGIYGRASYVNDDGAVVQVLPDESVLWYLRNLAVVGIGALVLLGIAIHIFGRLESNFAEEL